MAKELDVTKMGKIQASLGRASKLIQLESSGALDKIAKGVREGIGSDLLGEGAMDATALMQTKVPKASQAPISQRNIPQGTSKNIPSAILESFKNNPIDDTALYSAMGGGGDNALDFLTEGLVMESQHPRVQQQDISRIVSEGLGQQQQYTQQPQVQTASIDYPMIRTIVEDIVRKYAQSLNKRIISEGKDGGGNMLNTLTIGKSFKFLDSKGNIYEAKLTKIGNINDKKKSTIE